jgi:hypothetical protein
MLSAVFCYAPSDEVIAREIYEYLDRNSPIQPFFEEGRVRPGFDLIDAASQALSAEIGFVLLSAASVPNRWERDRWAPVLLDHPRELGSSLFFVQAGQCRFPDLLRRQAFADLSQDPLSGKRELKRHLFRKLAFFKSEPGLPPIEPGPSEIEVLRRQMADQPGYGDFCDRNTVLSFAHACQTDFEGVFWIDCAWRTRAGVLGDVADCLGLQLTGPMEQNENALGRFNTNRRCLFICENPPDDLTWFGGRSSLIRLHTQELRPVLPFEEVVSLFTSWTKRRKDCLCRLGDAQHHLAESDCEDAYRLGSPVVALLKNEQRLAEANELLELLITAAKLNKDEDAFRRFAWDQSWILGHWGEPYSSRSIPLENAGEPAQLALGF